LPFNAREVGRFWDFFTANIRNPYTGRAYYNTARNISEFCADCGVHDLAFTLFPAGYLVQALAKQR
jgi:hypothetical protein